MSISDNEIMVNYGNVSNVGDVLADADRAVQAVIEQLQDVINPLRATWSGASETEYNVAQNRWNNDIAAMQQLLVKYNSTLAEMAGNYGNTDNNLALQWGSIS